MGHLPPTQISGFCYSLMEYLAGVVYLVTSSMKPTRPDDNIYTINQQVVMTDVNETTGSNFSASSTLLFSYSLEQLYTEVNPRQRVLIYYDINIGAYRIFFMLKKIMRVYFYLKLYIIAKVYFCCLHVVSFSIIYCIFFYPEYLGN
jgi:hypothetical protein